MAITGKFAADFVNFYDACQKAEVSLKGFEQGSGKVETALNRMSNSLSGTKIIQDAMLMAEAVERVGGVSKLTEKELARVSSTAQEAAAKMKAMGIDVPPGIQKIADQATSTTGSFGNMKSMVAGLAGAFGLAFGIGSIVQFGRSVLNAGDAIQKMADQTGLSLQEVQKLQYVAGQSGTSVQSLVSAVQNLQQRLGDDNTGAAGAIRKLNINLDDFTKLSAYEQMTTLGTAIGAIEDPTERASVAAAIFGKNWKEILPAILAGMKELGDQAPRMSDAAVLAADRAGDAWERMKGRMVVAGGTLAENLEKIGSVLKGDFGLVDATASVGSFADAVNDLPPELDKIPPPTKRASDEIKALGLSASEAAKLERELTTSAEALIKVNADLAASAEKAAKAYQAMISEVNNATGMSQFNDALATQERHLKNLEGEWLMKRDAAQLAMEAERDAAKAQLAWDADLQKQNAEGLIIIGQTTEAHTEMGQAAVAATGAAMQGYAGLTSGVMMTAGAMVQLTEKQRLYNAVWNQMAFGGTTPQNMAAHASTAVFGMRAAGGPVSSGQPYMVGERGPELFVPRTSGSILPHGAGGGSVTVQVYMNGLLATTDPSGKAALRDAVHDAVMTGLRQSRKLGAA